MSPVSTLFGPVTENTLTDYALEMEAKYVDHAAVPNNLQCGLLGQHVRMLLAKDPATGEVALWGFGEPRMRGSYANLTEIVPLERSIPSATMLTILDANPPIDTVLGRHEPPPPGVMAVMLDPSLDSEQYVSADALPCRVQVRDQQVRMREMGIANVSASFESADVVGITFTQFDGALPNWAWPEELVASKQEKVLRVAADAIQAPQFLAFPFARDPFRIGPDACNQARALEDFIALQLEPPAGDVPAVATNNQPMPRIEDAEGMYFVDRFGIDIIERARMRRVYGTTTIFYPGDLSREGTWTPATQAMRLRAMVKHSETGFIEEDLLSLFHEAHFVYGADLSQKYGGDIWASIPDARTGDVCTRWSEKHFVDNCSERSTAAMHEQNRRYMIEDLAVANRLFADISPDAITLTAEELADPARSCAEGVFCDLPGGTYLNAIYRGDFALTQVLDGMLARARFDTVKGGFGAVGGSDQQAQILATVATSFEYRSVMPVLAKGYMYGYQRKPESCLKPGWKVHPETEYVDPVIAPGIDVGNISMPDEVITEGYWITVHYSINPNFFELCELVCDTVIPGEPYVTPAHGSISQGVQRVLLDNDCNSPEITQFEENLIKLTRQSVFAPPAPPFVERSSL